MTMQLVFDLLLMVLACSALFLAGWRLAKTSDRDGAKRSIENAVLLASGVLGMAALSTFATHPPYQAPAPTDAEVLDSVRRNLREAESGMVLLRARQRHAMGEASNAK